jgi:putative polyhydroxyalkanoic acid system protein
VSKFTMSIPHNLTRDEAKRRLQGAIAQARQQYGSLLALNERWEGDVLTFLVTAAGQSVSGQMFVEDTVVRVEAVLPWMLQMLAAPLLRRIEKQGREALENKSAPMASGSPP